MRDPAPLTGLFNDLFADRYRTVLCGDVEEPLYLPASGADPWHTIHFRRGYFSSALHEIAHWCLAGPKRRLLVDYGYWYVPDGRDLAQQRAFEQVEVKPQAIECLFAEAAKQPFICSADNLNAGQSCSPAFVSAVREQSERYRCAGLPRRAARFYRALQRL